MATFEDEVRIITDDIVAMLVSKNQKYGDAALNPRQVFSRAHPIELINVRIDDKLSRIQTQVRSLDASNDDEDAERDLIGYLILKRVAINRSPK